MGMAAILCWFNCGKQFTAACGLRPVEVETAYLPRNFGWLTSTLITDP